MDKQLERDELFRQIEELKEHIRILEKDLIHDHLTSLKTRAFFEEESTVCLSAINKSHNKSHKIQRRELFGFKHLSILFFDIDHFKNINDTYGHDIGDMVLKVVSETIQISVREGDTVARWGGEEIVANLLGANEIDAKEKADSIRRKIESLAFASTPDLKVTISIGVASNFTGATTENLVKNADLALYRAKQTGRNKVVAFSELGE